MNSGHGGNIRELAGQAGIPAENVCDFSANINPLGPPEWLRPVVSRALDGVANYPDPECGALVAVIAAKHGVAAENVVVGNGSSEIIQALPAVAGARRAVVPVPAYLEYARACESVGMEVLKLEMDENLELDWELIEREVGEDDLIFVGHPNNPTGITIDPNKLRELAAKHKGAVFVVDEAFIEFVEGGRSLLERRPENVVVLRSLTKFYAIPGIRLGFAVAAEELAARIRQALPPWSVNAIAQAVGERALRDADYERRAVATVAANRRKSAARLAGIDSLHVYPGEANFLLLRVTRPGFRASDFARRLLSEHGIAIRVCSNYDGLGENHFRVAIKSEKENDRLCDILEEEFSGRARTPRKRKTPAIMFQGCGSSAGKSFLATALCRVLLQDGVKVAPFKAQNMSLNSFVTRDGCEMGRAQVVQAQACKLDPDVRMNPVLLKPNSDTGSQVVVMGRPIGNMKAAVYTNYKNGLFDAVRQAYDSLAADSDAVVLEGAGSPAEINLKSNDIVNMRMARHAESPVLLAGDIDRGGVFAAFIGTLETMHVWERDLLAGFIVNRFRGDASLLGPALEYTRDYTGKPVLGIVPYITAARIPEEDSVQFKADGFGASAAGENSGEIDIAVVDLGHISNFTDFDPFAIEPDVNLRAVDAAAELGSPDAVILPGSKNVVADLERLKANGIAQAVRRLAESGKTTIVGVCAGFQMLGRRIEDPHGVESDAAGTAGLGLLDCETVIAAQKTLELAEVRHLGANMRVKGYEIHHGQTRVGGSDVLMQSARDDRILGAGNDNGTIWGTYLHGIFDNDAFRRWFIDGLRERKGLDPFGGVCAHYDLEEAFDHLASVFRESVDMDRIYGLLGL